MMVNLVASIFYYCFREFIDYLLRELLRVLFVLFENRTNRLFSNKALSNVKFHILHDEISYDFRFLSARSEPLEVSFCALSNGNKTTNRKREFARLPNQLRSDLLGR